LDIHESVCSNLLNNLPGMFYRSLCDEWYTLVFTTERSIDLTGYSPDNLTNNKKVSYRSLIHPDDKSWVMKALNQHIQNNENVNIEYRIICRQGRTRWVREISNGICDDFGSEYIEGYIEEITSKKDSSLMENAFDSYQKAINQSSIVSITTVNGTIVYANDFFCKTSKYEREELVGQTHKILNSDHHPKEFFKEMWRTILSGQVWQGLVRNRAKDGSYYWVDSSIAPVYNEDGELSQFLSIRSLVTERMIAQQRIRENEMYLQAVFDTVNDAIITVKLPERTITKINRATERMLGYSETEMVGRTTEFLFRNLNEFVSYGNHMEQSWKDPTHEFTTEIKLKRKDGSVIWCEVQTSELRSGEKLGALKAVSVVRDISERKEREEHLQSLVRDLTHRVSQNSQFNYIISHNLRAPLSNILGLTSLFANDASEVDSEVIGKINLSAARIDQTVKDLNQILAAETPEELLKEEIDVHELIRSQLQIVNPNSKIPYSLDLQLEAGTDRIHSTRVYLESIFYNLISNAFKYRKPGERLALTIKTYNNGGHFVGEVRDNGMGIDLKKHGNEIFGFYKRFHDQVQGKGLGLHLVKKHVETLGGNMEVESEYGKGTLFRFCIQTD